MVSAPGHAHLHAIKIQYTLTDFLLRDKLYPDTAPVLPTSFVTGDKIRGSDQPCTWIAPARIKFVPGLQKHVPYPPRTGINSCLKYQDPARMLRRVTQPPHIAGPLQVIVCCTTH